MRRLSSLGSKHLAHRKGRSALTAAGIMLGVGILFGVLVSNATTQTGVERLIADFTGNADVLVTPTGAFDATLPASTTERLAALPDVTVAVGSYSFLGGIKTDAVDEPQTISVRGVELESARRLQEYIVTRGRFFRGGQPELIVPHRLAVALELEAGAEVALRTPEGPALVRIVGIMTDTGAARSNQGDVAFTSLGQARAFTGVGDVISGARLQLRDGVDVDTWIRANEGAVGAGIDLRNAETLAQGFQDFLAILGNVFTFFAALTLFVGAFLIFLTLSMAIIERVRIYGTMRALGATRTQVRRVVLAEAVTLGAVSTAVGLAFGLLIAKGLLVLVSNLFGIDLPGLTITPAAIIAGIAVGLVTTIASALIPARRASRLSPVVAMKGDYAAEVRLSRAWIVGAVSLALGVIVGVTGTGEATALATPLLLLGGVLLTPPLLRPLARVLGRLTNRLAGGVGKVAVLHLVKERSRSAYTLALIMVVMSMIFSIGALYTTLNQQLDKTFDTQFGADVQIFSGGNGPPASLGKTFESELRSVPGVGEFTAIRFARVRTAASEASGSDRDGFARIIDPDSYFRVVSFSFTQGTVREAQRALIEGDAVLIPTDRAGQLDKGVGDTLAFDTTQGPKEFRIAGVYTSIGGPPETVFGLPDARRYLNAGDPAGYQVNLERGADLDAVLVALRDGIGERYSVEIVTAATAKADAQEQFGQFFNIFYAILLVAAVVGLLGLANTLAMSVLQRYREIGILRAIGTTRSQVRRMVLVESATLGLVAFVLSLPLGLLMSVLAVRGIGAAFGFEIEYLYPAGWVPGVIGFGIFVAVVAALAPGRRAARLEVVGALQYE